MVSVGRPVMRPSSSIGTSSATSGGSPSAICGLPVRGRQHLSDGCRAAGRAVAGRVAERGVPEHVVPIGMRREARHDRLAQGAKVVRDGRHLVARDAGVDEQHPGVALHDDGVALDALALVHQHALGHRL